MTTKLTPEDISNIRKKAKKGVLKNKLAKQYKVSKKTIIKYTHDIHNKYHRNKLSEEIVYEIRDKAKKGIPKIHLAHEYNVNVKTIYSYTYDIKKNKKRNEEIKKKINQLYLQGKTKYAIAKELNLPLSTIYYISRDLTSIDINFKSKNNKTIKLLEILLDQGYVFPSKLHYKSSNFQVLKKHFPKIHRIYTRRRTIIFLQDRKDVACRAFLEDLKNNGKIIDSYQELKQIIKMFNVGIEAEEKRKFINKQKKRK